MSLRQNYLLSTAKLKVAPLVKGGIPRKNRLTVKNVPAATYLNINKEQLYILEQFGDGKTSQEVLLKLIQDSKAPRLREYYELILKAYQNRILLDDNDPLPPKAPPLSFGIMAAPWFVFIFGFLSVGLAIYSQYAFPLELPNPWWSAWPGVLIASLALSFGQIIAAGCLRHYGAEVYQAHFHWKTLIPHFAFNLMDARMVNHRCETYVGCARYLPLLFALGVTAIIYPPATIILFLPLIAYSFPYRQGPVDQIIKGLSQRVALDIHRDFLFHPRPSSIGGWLQSLRKDGKRYLSLKIIYILLWLSLAALLTFYGTAFMQTGAVRRMDLNEALTWVSVTIVGSLICFLILLLVRDSLPGLRSFLAKRKEKKAEAQRLASFSEANPPSEDEMVDLLQHSFIFGDLSRDDCRLLVQNMKPRFCGKGEILVSEKEDQNEAFVVFSGSLQVQKELSDGKTLKLATLGRGDVFGKIPLWNEVPRRRTIQTLAPSIVYSFKESQFTSIVLSTESHMAIRDAVKASFLSRLKVFQGWTPAMIRALARMGTFTSTPQKQNIITEGQPNQFFYIIYDGVVEIIRKGKKINTLRIGDFFGELSVLRNTLAISDVHCREAGRSLVFSKKDFLRFLSTYPQAALTFEAIASARLGYPVFPVKRV